ncbi:MAG: hypothetical protein N3E45_11885 [Oscillatoriaceae bacterium SKW80]|nr:hypothetical protein [Oscillatoriaceae bacterium SKYG93]MCX8121503.1 hypothetical protein [Oscillatoriaceae bacterium SKW80]MDW8452911.1 hypothetical protein [Oscillatoriaceae cyanobacterium SKYGB_i_bin93]HIK27848.1 hypothetical protein [Oscillatoriaceae cyanobacterium M7585_C2015_266]
MRGSFATMQTQLNVTELTFYYDNGQAETFKVPVSPQTIQSQLKNIFTQPLLTFHLIDQTVIIYTGKIMKVEIKPVLSELTGEGVFTNSERIMALQRGAAR